jgi:hypothetical protein
MIPRIEQKLEINKKHYLDLLKWINNKGGKVLYPERIICSRYFDNNNLQMYFDTIEGIIPRKKIRIRTYGSEDFISSNNQYSLEIKLSNEHCRFKKTNSNLNLGSLLKDGYNDNLYGICKQLIDVSYVREYFLVKNIRVTIDKEIKYRLINLNNNFKKEFFEDQTYVFEIKADIDTNLSYLLNNFDFPRSRFSKYERALDSLLK